MKFITAFLILFATIVQAAEFQIEKQKLKFSFDYESFVDVLGNEVMAPGLKANYLFKGYGTIGKSVVYQIDYQTGAKTNLETSFQSGELASFLWSNRFNTSLTVPLGKFYAGGNLYLRHKYVSEEPNQFVDLFGGLGYRDVESSAYIGFFPAENWEVTAAAVFSDVNFKYFSDSNSSSTGGTVRASRRFENFKLNLDYRRKRIEYNRPAFESTATGPIYPVDSFGNPVEQVDDFQELGFIVEFHRPFYFSGGYSYQHNDSNNPGFAYRNHRFNILIGTEIGDDFHLQAYGIAQRQVFDEAGRLAVPVFLDDSDYDTMGISLVRTIREHMELEFGGNRLNNNSSFQELDESKFILFAALNYRF